MFVKSIVLLTVMVLTIMASAAGIHRDMNDEAGVVLVDRRAEKIGFVLEKLNNFVPRADVVTITVTNTVCEIGANAASTTMPPDHSPGFPNSPLVSSEVPAPTNPAATTDMVGVNSTPVIIGTLGSETSASTPVLSSISSEKASFSSTKPMVSSAISGGSSASGTTAASTPTPSGHAVHNAGLGSAMLAGAVGFAALVAM